MNIKIKKRHISSVAFFGTLIFICASFVLWRAELTIAEDICSSVKECDEKKEAYEEIIKLKQKQQATLGGQINVIVSEIQNVEGDIAENEKSISEINNNIEELIRKINQQEELIELQKKVLARLIRTYYDYDQRNVVSIILDRDGFSGKSKDQDYLSQTSGKTKEILLNIKSLKSATENNKKELEDSREKIIGIKTELEKKTDYLESARSQKRTLLVQAQGDEKKYQELLNIIENEIYELEAGKFADLSKLPAAKGGYFDYPVSVPVLTQSYGCLKDSFARKSYPSCDDGKGGFHNGTDFGRNSGDMIYAVRKGKVIGSGNNGNYAYGQWLTIDHGDGLVSLYGHLSAKYVSNGDKVDTGEKIGKMGTTGYSTGTHLHFSVFAEEGFGVVESKYVDGLFIPTGASVNPMRYLK